jgi:hypothetical protein
MCLNFTLVSLEILWAVLNKSLFKLAFEVEYTYTFLHPGVIIDLNKTSKFGRPNNTFIGLWSNSLLSINVFVGSYFKVGSACFLLRPQTCLLKLINRKALQNKKLGNVFKFLSSVKKILNSSFVIIHGALMMWNK